jgi:crotonobetainyl-CoA:carnitine CoA-transferase CaiB-like acyl-CoA transferase
MTEPRLLGGLRVVDLSTEITGPYATKLLVDAGAEVVKVEPREGDPLRRWSASGARPEGTDGALFRYLHAGKRAVIGNATSPAVRALVADADLLVESGQLVDDEIREMANAHPRLTILSVTPFGRSGPWVGRPSTEFTLQAECGSIAGRGVVEREPLHAGGRLGEWIGGVYAAVAGLAAARAARRSGRGDHVDVSLLECMSIAMGGNAALGQTMGMPSRPGPPRTTEMPSIEPTADGYVGFCTITGQQFQDFLALIDHAELLGDAELASFVGRQARREEFLSMVWDWTTKHSTEEIVDVASAMRIPVAPIGTPETLTGIDQFVDRGVFVSSGDGAFLQPRIPYRIDGEGIPGPGRPPGLGEHDDTTWSPRPPEPSATNGEGRATLELPLTGIRVIDLTAFWAGPAATQILAMLGADVIKVESIQRPDGMRLNSSRPPSEDGWWEWSSVFQGANTNKRDVTLDLNREEGRRLLLEMVKRADVLIENFSPRVLDNFGITWEAVHAANPRAVMVRMPAFGLSGPWRERGGFAQTMEQATGMAWMTGFPDGPALIPRGPCDPIAGLHAAFGVIAALEERDRSGRGHFIESTMVEAALNVAAEVVIENSAYGTALMRDGNRGPVSAPQGLYPCDGVEQWLALAVATNEQWHALRGVLGDPEWAQPPALSEASGRRDAHDLIDKELAAFAARHRVEDLVVRLVAAGIPAARVVEPTAVIENPQLRARGFVESIDGPVVGRHELLSAPFRFASRTGGWVVSPAPTLGQDNDAVLGGLLGLDRDELSRLREERLIGERFE